MQLDGLGCGAFGSLQGMGLIAGIFQGHERCAVGLPRQHLAHLGIADDYRIRSGFRAGSDTQQ